MSKNHEGNVKQYRLVSEAWDASFALEHRGYVDEVTFGLYHPDGGTSGEMGVRWYPLWDEKPAPRLEVFDDGWHALAQFKDVIDALAEVDDQSITPKEFCELLKRCGFTDATPRERK